MQHSYTSINTFKVCPKKYEFRYIQKLPRIVTPAMKTGTLLHNAISASLLGKPDLSMFPMEDRAEAERLVQNAIRYIGERTVVATEHQLGMSRNFNSRPFAKARFRGVIDALVFDPVSGMELIDFKTNYADYPKTQLLFYTLLSSATFGVLPNKITYFSLRFNQAISYPVDLEELVQFRSELLKQARKIETEKEFKPNPGEHCSNCEYIHQCPAAQILSIPAVNSQETALAILKEADAHSAHASKLKKAAQDFVKLTGCSIQDTGREFKPNVGEAVSITDMNLLKVKLEEAGYDPEKYRNVDTKLLKQIPDFKNRFKDCIKISNRTTYKWFKDNTNNTTGKEVKSHDESRKTA